MTTTLNTLLIQARHRLAANSESPRLDAEVLLGHVLRADRAHLYANPNRQADDAQVAAFEALVKQRCQGRPVAHLTGQREFWSLPMHVTPDVLVPRPETELLVEQALHHIPVSEPCEVADLGCGSGAIAIAIATERPTVSLTAIDSSSAALDIARVNATTHNCEHIRFLEGSWFAPANDQRFAVIVSNPPYVATDHAKLTDPELAWEPQQALYSGTDGLDDIRLIIATAPAYLEPGGLLLLEHGFDQAGKIAALLAQAGFNEIRTHLDLAENPRVTEGRFRTQE